MPLRRPHRTDLFAPDNPWAPRIKRYLLLRHRCAPRKRRMEYICNDSSPPPACADPPPFLYDSFSRHRSRPRLCSRTATPSKTQFDDTIDCNTRSFIRPDTLRYARSSSSCKDFCIRWFCIGRTGIHQQNCFHSARTD
ncbi:hypothetical protein FOMG_07505 [Fusarium oxysporum f. sp. melonis 26406]|uniref:Uncharacterized protein n=1 Tax=Fusarium oxysporum f. sp. melonis 26406 TaxID=1089452 RepID=X0B6I7_FUSOX|nr:hypothetical protein FOMG_07505 [Fusarium oxysporum f. sp. melonis 26406]